MSLIIKIMAGVIFAQMGRVASLLEIPVANFKSSYLPRVEVSSNLSLAFSSGDKHFFDMDYAHVNVYFFNNFAIGLNYFTRREVGLDFAYKIISGPYLPSLAVGVRNITYKRYINPAGGEPPDGGFVDENYTGKKYRIPELLSFYIVGSYTLQKYTFHVGLGRGEFIGYGPRSKYLNFDIFSETAHELTLGLFFGFEYEYTMTDFLLDKVRFAVEVDGRDLNMGIIGELGTFSFTVELLKMEHIIFESNLHPRIGFAVSYKGIYKGI